MSVSFPRLGKFSANILLSKFSAPLSFLLFVPVIQLLVCMMLFCKSHKLSSLFFILSADCINPTVLFWGSLILSYTSSSLLLSLSVEFFRYCFLQLYFCLVLIFSIPLKCSLCSCIVILTLTSIFIAIILNSSSAKLLISIS